MCREMEGCTVVRGCGYRPAHTCKECGGNWVFGRRCTWCDAKREGSICPGCGAMWTQGGRTCPGCDYPAWPDLGNFEFHECRHCGRLTDDDYRHCQGCGREDTHEPWGPAEIAALVPKVVSTAAGGAVALWVTISVLHSVVWWEREPRSEVSSYWDDNGRHSLWSDPDLQIQWHLCSTGLLIALFVVMLGIVAIDLSRRGYRD